MYDPLKHRHPLSLSATLFLAGLLALLGFVYFTDRADAAMLYTTIENDASQVTTGFATGYQNAGTAACINQVNFQLLRTGGNTSTVQANILYGETPNESGSLSTSTNFYTQQEIETSATTTSFYFSPCVNIPAYNKAWIILNAQNKSGLQTRVGNGTTPFGWGGIYPNLTDNGVGNINSSTLPVQEWFGSGEGLATGNETIEFRFPTDGIETPDFSNWIIVSNELNASKTYWFNIKAYLSTSTVSTTEQGTTFTDISSFTGASSTNFWTIAKSQSLTPSPDGFRTWTITAKICGEPYCFIPLATDEVIFDTNYTSTIPDTPYTELAGPFHNPDDNLYRHDGIKLSREYVDEWTKNKTTLCGDIPASVVDIGGWTAWGLCKVMDFALRPSDVSYTFLSDNFNLIQKIYPFKYAFDIIQQMKNGNIIDTDLSPTLSLNMNTAFDREDATFILLSSSTLTGQFGSSTSAQIRSTATYAVWAITIGIMIATMLI